MTLKFGSDPETFASYTEGNKSYVVPPAYLRRFAGLEYTPDPEGRHPKFMIEDGITVHEDGAAFEFTVPPANSLGEVLKTIHKGYQMLQDRILSNYNFSLKIIPTINYEVNRWREFYNDEEFLQSILFGCDPHKLAWDVEKEDAPVDASRHKYRYGGGHIHISGEDVFKENSVLCARTLDMTVGLAALAFSPVPELEKIRTFRYGLPGVWRPQAYPDGSFGMEYRSVSNAWTNPENSQLAQQVEKWLMFALDKFLLNDLEKAEDLLIDLRSPLIKAISTSNQKLAKQLLNVVEGA